jgi:hypothetical protein
MAADSIEAALLQAVAGDGIADTGAWAASLGADHQRVVGVMKSLEMAAMISVEVSGVCAVLQLCSSGWCCVCVPAQQSMQWRLLQQQKTARAPLSPQDIDNSRAVLTKEAQGYLTTGSPEGQLFALVPPGEGLPLAAAKASLPAEVSGPGFVQAMQQKWVALDKSGPEPRITRQVTREEGVGGCGWGRACAVCSSSWQRSHGLLCCNHLLNTSRSCLASALPAQVDAIVDTTQQQLAAVAAGQELPKAELEKLKKRRLVKQE